MLGLKMAEGGLLLPPADMLTDEQVDANLEENDKTKVSRWQIGTSSLGVLEQVYAMEPFPGAPPSPLLRETARGRIGAHFPRTWRRVEQVPAPNNFRPPFRPREDGSPGPVRTHAAPGPVSSSLPGPLLPVTGPRATCPA